MTAYLVLCMPCWWLGLSLRDSICGLIGVVVKPGLRKVASKSLNSEVCRVVPSSVGRVSGLFSPLSLPTNDLYLVNGHRPGQPHPESIPATDVYLANGYRMRGPPTMRACRQSPVLLAPGILQTT